MARSLEKIRKTNELRICVAGSIHELYAAIQKGTSYHSWLETQNAGPLAPSTIQIRFMTTDESMQAVDAKSAYFTINGRQVKVDLRLNS